MIAEDRTLPRESERARGSFAAPAKAFQGKARGLTPRHKTQRVYIYITFEKTYHAEENLITQGRAPCIILSPLPNLLLSLPSLQARKSAHTRTCPFPSQCEKSSMSGSEGHGTLTQQATASYHFPGPEDLCF